MVQPYCHRVSYYCRPVVPTLLLSYTHRKLTRPLLHHIQSLLETGKNYIFSIFSGIQTKIVSLDTAGRAYNMNNGSIQEITVTEFMNLSFACPSLVTVADPILFSQTMVCSDNGSRSFVRKQMLSFTLK